MERASDHHTDAYSVFDRAARLALALVVLASLAAGPAVATGPTATVAVPWGTTSAASAGVLTGFALAVNLFVHFGRDT